MTYNDDLWRLQPKNTPLVMLSGSLHRVARFGRAISARWQKGEPPFVSGRMY